MLLQRRIRDEQIIFSTKLLTEAQISAFPAEMRQAVSTRGWDFGLPTESW